jgi:hypothetical protein
MASEEESEMASQEIVGPKTVETVEEEWLRHVEDLSDQRRSGSHL